MRKPLVSAYLLTFSLLITLVARKTGTLVYTFPDLLCFRIVFDHWIVNNISVQFSTLNLKFDEKFVVREGPSFGLDGV